VPKKIKFEAFKNHFLVNANDDDFLRDNKKWKNFLSDLKFDYKGKEIIIYWKQNLLEVDISQLKLYTRGDSEINKSSNIILNEIKNNNLLFFKRVVKKIAKLAKFIN
jgi:hypothetical protein